MTNANLDIANISDMALGVNIAKTPYPCDFWENITAILISLYQISDIAHTCRILRGNVCYISGPENEQERHPDGPHQVVLPDE